MMESRVQGIALRNLNCGIVKREACIVGPFEIEKAPSYNMKTSPA